MLVTNEKAAGAGGFHWSPDEIKDIPADLAAELVAIKDAGFTIVAEVEAEVEKILTEVEPTKTEVAPVKPKVAPKPADVLTEAPLHND